MSVLFGRGNLSWLAADPVTTVYTISSLSFQPKAILFVICGSDAVDVNHTETARWCYGFATSTSDRRCVGLTSVDGTAAQDTQEIYRTDAVLATVSAAGAVDGLLDLNSLTSNGFTLVVDDTAPVNLRVFWFAWGGTDILTAATGEITEPAAIGNQSYSVTGWLSGPTGDGTCAVLFAGCQLTGAAPTAAQIDSGMMLGAAAGIASSNQWVNATNEDEGSATMDTDRYFRAGECLAMIASAGGNPNARASFNGFDAVGFDLNWIARATTNRRYIYLALQGGSWKAGSYTIDLTTVGNTTTVAGLTFRPVGAILATHDDAENAAGTSSTGCNQSVGGWVSTASRQTLSYDSQNAQANAVVHTKTTDAGTLAAHGSSTLEDWIVDLDVVNSDGFRVIVDNIPDTPRTIINGFLAFGDTAPPVLAFFPSRVAREQVIQSSGFHPGRMN